MKKLQVSWEGVHDSTGYLFSFAKSLSAAVKNSPYSELAEDIVAASGFAFRMWVSADLCPSATSMWNFEDQKKWVGNGGLCCDYVGRYWGQEDIEEQKRLIAIDMIKKSIDNGIPAVSWDIGVPEWGLVTGYDDDAKTLSTLSVAGSTDMLPYDVLGKRELPILSVLVLTGKLDKPKEDILNDTMKLAASHLNGEEWCENAKGLAAYPALIKHFEENSDYASSWNAEYFLGTFGALKEYAYRYFDKSCRADLAEIYKAVYQSWLEAFNMKTSRDAGMLEVRLKIAELLKAAYEKEKQAVKIMEKSIKNL